jgi:Rps23 Pro-64 3,4-dihydroxylase Tpa1-like proline 4-hydroxylase
VDKIVALRNPIYERVAELLAGLFPGEDLLLYRASTNSNGYGEIHFPHRDHDLHTRHLTVIYYANDEWPMHYGGHTLFHALDHEPLLAVGIRPGRMVIFRGAITHEVGVPTKHCEMQRFATVFRFYSLAPLGL